MKRHKQSNGKARVANRRASVAAALGVVLAVGLVAAFWSRDPGPPVPDPDTEGMERNVAEKIASTRAVVEGDARSAAEWGRLGMVFHAHELFAEAAICYRRARELSDDDFRWPYLEAQALKEARELEASLEVLAAALALRPDYAPLHVLEAELYESAGDVERATAAYRRALAVDDRCAPAHFGLGRASLSEGSIEDSREHLERARELAPSSGAVRATLARLYRRLGDRDRALEAAALARELHPEVPLDDPTMAAVAEEAVSVVGLQSRAVTAESRGETRRAEGLLRQMIALRPDEANLYYNLGNNLARQGRAAEAEAQYREALLRRPDHVAALINLGNVLAQSGDLTGSEALFRKALSSSPDHAGALGSLAKVALSRGDMSGAAALLERAIESDPRRTDEHFVLGQVLRRQGRSAASVAMLERAIELSPQRGDIHFELAVTLAEQGSFRQAWRHVHDAEATGWQPPIEFLAALRARMPDPG